ncbi:amidohydrolase family protein [Halioxenophilus sp. WMMB6]|uniref:amidohydrolase family protein n=1 Tax=Halioxenophilus sp. WMMB6 TaxID=3073815 RepID=UPI00295E8316|nr:amidohydrolase family protein [Halioxenophilus sp. WMMB6]
MNKHWRILLLVAVFLTEPVLAKESVALLVKNATLITVAEDQPDAFLGYMTVADDGRIVAVAAGEPPAVSAKKVIDLAGAVVAPGFISAHSHIYMSPLRGLGHDQNLYGWFKAWDYYLRHTNADDIYWFTLHGSLDFLRNGITTAYDFTYPPAVDRLSDDPSTAVAPTFIKPGPFEENQIKAKLDAGLRFINSPWLSEVGSDEEIIARYQAVYDFAKPLMAENPLFLKMAVSGAQQFNPTNRTAKLEGTVMHEFGVINQSHFLESPSAVEEQQKKFDWYLDAGVLGPDFIFGHFIHTNDYILQKVVETGAKMSWQPTSNGRLADGIADVVKYRELGIPVAVGLDDQSCTDVSDPFQNLRIGLYTMRGLYKKSDVLSIQDMLYLHTLGSAKVLGIDKDVGSLEPGKFADFIVVDLRDPDTGPIYEPLASYVLASSLRNLKQVWVGGKQVADGTHLLTFDEKKVRKEIDQRVTRIQQVADTAE